MAVVSTAPARSALTTVSWDRVWRLVPVTLAFGLIAFLLFVAYAWLRDLDRVRWMIGNTDHAIYAAQAQRVLAGGPLYPAWQLAGPFSEAQRPELYPPQTVYGLFVPMSLLPAWVWWAVPIGIVIAVIVHHRPSWWGWVGILACLSVPHTWISIAAGNPVMYASAAVALGTIFGAASVLVILKPTMAIFALLGVRTRSWWAMALAGLASTILLAPAWIDYVTVLRNDVEADVVTSAAKNLPLVAIGLFAWLGSSPGHRSLRRPSQSSQREDVSVPTLGAI